MSADFSGEHAALAPDARGTAPPRPRRRDRRAAASLVRTRLLRGVQRQLPIFIIVTVLVSGVGVLYELADRVALLTALPRWLAIGAGGALAVSVALELARNTVTSIASLGRHRGYTVVGAAPELTPAALRELAPEWRTPIGSVVFEPASGFATAFRDLQGAIAGDRLVSFIAPIPNEGASTAALCAAVSAQQQGRRVVLVDCDVRRRSLTRRLGLEPKRGVLQAAERPQIWREIVDHEPESGLAIIPATEPQNLWRGIADAPGTSTLLRELRHAYDLVVLDCPPALANAEGAWLASQADKCVVVAAWDDTTMGALRASMRALRHNREPTVAIFVNRVPPGYRFGRLRPG